MTPITTEISNEEFETMRKMLYDDQLSERHGFDHYQMVDNDCLGGEVLGWVGVERNGWPFPITNGVRNAESRSLLDNKQKPSTIKPSLDNEQDALL